MEKGFIKLFRKMKDWEWYTNETTFRVFIHLLLCANWETKTYRGVKILRGQVVKKQEDIARELKITNRKGQPQRQPIRTALNNLKSTNDITIEKSHIGSIITINNYNEYQQLTNNSTINQPHINQQTNHKSTTTKEEEEIKNNIHIYIKPSWDEVKSYFERLGFRQAADEFYEFFEKRKWTINNQLINNWEDAAKSWVKLNHNLKEQQINDN